MDMLKKGMEFVTSGARPQPIEMEKYVIE